MKKLNLSILMLILPLLFKIDYLSLILRRLLYRFEKNYVNKNSLTIWLHNQIS